MRSEQVVGIVLVAAGALLLVVFRTPVGAAAIPLVVGLGFLVAYAATRLYGLLIPAGIVTGLGSGIVVAAAGGPGPSPVLGLGLGFLAIYAVDRLAQGGFAGSWWPLIPGGILTAVGLTAMPAVRGLWAYAFPLGLIVAGLALVLLGGRGRSGGQASPPGEHRSTVSSGRPRP